MRRLQYGKILESSTFMGRTADFLWMLILGGAAMLVQLPQALHELIALLGRLGGWLSASTGRIAHSSCCPALDLARSSGA